MTKYWLFIINKENWEMVKKTNIIGSNYEDKTKIITPNDILVVYAIKPMSSILATYKVISKFKENKKIFVGDIYPHRLRIEPIKILKTPILFKELIYKFSFIKNKNKWQLYLFGARGVRELAIKDYNIIEKEIDKN